MGLYAAILIVEDDAHTREGLRRYLEALDYEVFLASDAREGFELFQKEKPDLVLSDVRMPGGDGVELLDKIKNLKPDATVILLTAYGSVEDAVKAMKRGAYYYLTKPVNLEELEFLIKKALSRKNLEEENKELREALFREKFERGEITAHSDRMKEVLKTVDQIAKSASTVLIEGESGTGKELIAHRIYQGSPRRQKPFVAVHCAALTETLLASELFGHEKGAFTGATERKVGRFERAHEGTLFLDEIGEISQETQVKLLRVLQDGEFERVGGTKSIHADVRLVCATNKNLAEEVRAGRFREDLYYRINVIYLKVPPLRERKEDIPVLIDEFIRQYAKANRKPVTGIDDAAVEALGAYTWPGNIRELKNIIERMIVLCPGDRLTLENVPEDIRFPGALRPATGFTEAAPPSGKIEDMEKSMIVRALQEVQGNKSLAAKNLGISRRTLYRKMDEYGI